MASSNTRRVTASGLEVRAVGDDVTVEGYAATFGQGYDMGWYTETVQRGAFTKTLTEKPDVQFLVNHDGLPLARSTSGTLDLAQDSTGLHTRARLDPSDPDVQRILPKLKRGDMDRMSFAFRVVKQKWSEDYTQRSLDELSLATGDVSLVTFPANPNTSISIRARQVLDADPNELRAAYQAIHEERAGKTISAATQRQLEAVLESLDTIDEATDTAVEQIAELIGATTVEPDADDSVRSGRPVRNVRERLRLAGLHL